MPRGQPDYGVYAAKELAAGAADLGEAAARLGSIVTYDRRGDVLLLDDFEDDLAAWEIETSGAGASVKVSTEHKLRGFCSMKLVAGSNVNRYAKATLHWGPVPAARFGLEVAYTMDAHMESAESGCNYYSGAYKISMGCKFDMVNKKLYVLTTGGLYQEVPVVILPVCSPYVFYFIKGVFDVNLLTYIRGIVAMLSFDLSSIPLSVMPDFTSPMFESYIKLISLAGYNAISYLDSAIITFNEP